jgi:hypothetical protein
MDLAAVIGLFSSFVTIEEAGRCWRLIVKDKLKKKEVDINNWDSDDPVVQACLDRFKTDMGDKYKDHISASGTYSTISPKSTFSVLQILLRIVRLTSSSRRNFVIVLGAISAFLRKSDLLISLSTNNFHNRLYDTAIIISPFTFYLVFI